MSDIVICSNLRVQPDKSHSTERIQPEAALRMFPTSSTATEAFLSIKKNELIPICLGFSSRICLTPELLRYGKGLSCVCDGCTNHQNNQIIDVFLWRLSSALLHFNASQRDSGWGMESAGRHFDSLWGIHNRLRDTMSSPRGHLLTLSLRHRTDANTLDGKWGWSFLPV